MKHIINKSKKYYDAKNGELADGIFSDKEIEDSILGLILYYLRVIKEENNFPEIKLGNLQKQKNYFLLLNNIKNKYYTKIQYQDKKIYLSIFLSLEMPIKEIRAREKI